MGSEHVILRRDIYKDRLNHQDHTVSITIASTICSARSYMLAYEGIQLRDVEQ